MTVHHRSHQERIDAGLAFDWDLLPAAVTTVAEIPGTAQDARLLRKGKSLRGISRLGGLRRVWAYGVDQDLLDELCALPALEVLFIDRVTAADLSPIGRLDRLSVLSVGSAPRLSGLSWLPVSGCLDALGLSDLKSLRDISGVETQTRLRAVAVDGGALAPMHIESLRPLSSLTELRFVSLVNCRVADKSLQPLCSLAELTALHCARFYPRQQFQALAAAQPALRCDWFAPEAWAESDD